MQLFVDLCVAVTIVAVLQGVSGYKFAWEKPYTRVGETVGEKCFKLGTGYWELKGTLTATEQEIEENPYVVIVFKDAAKYFSVDLKSCIRGPKPIPFNIYVDKSGFDTQDQCYAETSDGSSLILRSLFKKDVYGGGDSFVCKNDDVDHCIVTEGGAGVIDLPKTTEPVSPRIAVGDNHAQSILDSEALGIPIDEAQSVKLTLCAELTKPYTLTMTIDGVETKKSDDCAVVQTPILDPAKKEELKVTVSWDETEGCLQAGTKEVTFIASVPDVPECDLDRYFHCAIDWKRLSKGTSQEEWCNKLPTFTDCIAKIPGCKDSQEWESSSYKEKNDTDCGNGNGNGASSIKASWMILAMSVFTALKQLLG